jgi:hypothetical protein
MNELECGGVVPFDVLGEATSFVHILYYIFFAMFRGYIGNKKANILQKNLVFFPKVATKIRVCVFEVFTDGGVIFDGRACLFAHNPMHNNRLSLCFFDMNLEMVVEVFLIEPLWLLEGFHPFVFVVVYVNS